MRLFNLLFIFLLSGCCTVVPQSFKDLNIEHQQVILVKPSKHNIHSALLSFWQQENGQWHKKYSYSAVIGKNGVAAPGMKKEGDGRTPSGTYDLGTAFGYAPSIVSGLKYQRVGADDFWVDDPASTQYNQWVKGSPAAKSFEKLKRDDNLYRLAIVIEYNTNPIIPGAGSAIFMHIWRGYDHFTSGCVALAERNLSRIARYLDKSQKPVIMILER